MGSQQSPYVTVQSAQSIYNCAVNTVHETTGCLSYMHLYLMFGLLVCLNWQFLCIAKFFSGNSTCTLVQRKYILLTSFPVRPSLQAFLNSTWCQTLWTKSVRGMYAYILTSANACRKKLNRKYAGHLILFSKTHESLGEQHEIWPDRFDAGYLARLSFASRTYYFIV